MLYNSKSKFGCLELKIVIFFKCAFSVFYKVLTPKNTYVKM